MCVPGPCPWVCDPQGTKAPTLTLSLAPRGCTDIICCVFLLLAIVGYVAVGIIGEWRREQDLGFQGEREATDSLWVRSGTDAEGWRAVPQCLWILPQLGPMETLER